MQLESTASPELRVLCRNLHICVAEIKIFLAKVFIKVVCKAPQVTKIFKAGGRGVYVPL